MTQKQLAKITRLTLVTPDVGRQEFYGVKLEFSVQDDGRTLKIFLTERPEGFTPDMREWNRFQEVMTRLMDKKTEAFGHYRIHAYGTCSGACPFHAPSDHPLNESPINIRMDKDGLVERICPHGVGHDDPDSVAFLNGRGAHYGVHGCDGCCTGDYRG